MATTEQMTHAAQRRVRHLARIRHDIETKGRPPTAGELGAHEGISRRAVQVDLDAMERAGLIEQDPGVVRGIRLAGFRVQLVPVEPVAEGRKAKARAGA